jgi:predicted enzyme related to lactoylglutathione lyase
MVIGYFRGGAVEHQVRLWIFAADTDRARTFYVRVFGWSLPQDGHCWMLTPGDDPRLGVDDLDPTGADPTGEPGIPTIHVADLDATTATARAAGGDVLVPRIPLPGVGWLVYLADTEGNLLSIMQDDPHAAWPTGTAPGTRRRPSRRPDDPGPA